MAGTSVVATRDPMNDLWSPNDLDDLNNDDDKDDAVLMDSKSSGCSGQASPILSVLLIVFKSVLCCSAPGCCSSWPASGSSTASSFLGVEATYSSACARRLKGVPWSVSVSVPPGNVSSALSRVGVTDLLRHCQHPDF
jgi:hypothetical protein